MIYTKTSCVLPVAIKDKLYQMLEKVGLEDSSVQVSYCTGKGDNFIGVLYRIFVSQGKTQLHLICKTEPESETRRQEVRTDMLFTRELLVFQKVFRGFGEMQKEKGINDDIFFNNYPKVFGAAQGFFFMNDLREEGYKMCARDGTLDYDHMKKTIEAFAKFHALGLAMKTLRPNYFNKCKNKMREDYFGFPIKQPLYSFIRAMFDHVVETLEDDEENIKEKLRELQKNLETVLPDYLTSKDAEPYRVFTHGDCWNNNMMYKYDENCKPSRVCILDYQVSRYGSPALDLSFLFFCCTDKELRDGHYDDLLRLYHQTFCDVLSRLDCDPSKLFPYEALVDQMKRFGGYGLIMATMLIKSLMCSSEYVVDMDEVAALMKEDDDYAKGIKIVCRNQDQRYKIRMSSAVRDAVRLGMI